MTARGSGGGLRAGLGLRAALGRGKAIGVVNLCGTVLEWWGDGGVELVGVRAGRRRCSGLPERREAKQVGEKKAAVLWVLKRARISGLSCCSGLATAASRWRPRDGPGRRGEGRELQREEGGRWGGSGATRGCQREAKAKLELAGEAAGGAAREAGEQGKRRKGACLQYLKIPRT